MDDPSAEVVTEASDAPPATAPDFPIVAVGASAGGIEPFLELLGNVGEHPGVAFVFILHQERHRDELAKVVARATKMPVVRAEDGMLVEANRVYVAPSDAVLTMEGDCLAARPRLEARELPIDIFFRSLSAEHGSRAIAVVLSGSASDGALGTRAVKAEGGITFAQDRSAKFPQMPHAAGDAGSIDYVLPPRLIAEELLRIGRHFGGGDSSPRLPARELSSVFALLHAFHDVDFTHYKPSTIERRIRRRMAMHKLDDLAEYVALLRENDAEREQLYGDLLIRVTSFFRDPEVFEAVARDILPAMIRERDGETPLRIWVPGCATGEEVYSLAITLLEAEYASGVASPIQIFGTDISEAALERARQGIYPDSISAEVSPERLRRFFTASEGEYRVAKAVRDCCIFARQDLTRDPPFSRLDLISCRNVLIYLGEKLQRKVMSIFHYALRPQGCLLLGSSETIGNFGDLFAVADRAHKIYRKKPGRNAFTMGFEPAAAPREKVEKVRMPDEATSPGNVFREADRLMLARFSPPAVLINESMDVLQFRGRTGTFLEPPAGVASFNVLKMAREGLVAELRAAITAARAQEVPVRREGIRMQAEGGPIQVNIEVMPFAAATRERYQIILFEQVAEPAPAAKQARGKKSRPEADTRESGRLRRELEATREYLQSIIEEQEAMNEELRSANEEIQSSNEELQSTNEELETAKEELQSSNEELTTLNEELENRNDEMGQANNDLTNLLASVDLPIVMLDNNLRVRRFNPGAQRVLSLINGDVGRPLGDLKTTLLIDDLEQMIRDVIENLETREVGVQDRRGQWYSLRVRPCRTTENRIEGAVLVLIDRKT